MEIAKIIFLVVVNSPLFMLIGKLLFGDWQKFREAVRFWLTPDFISIFRGEWGDDFFAELKLGIFIAICAGLVIGELKLISMFLL